ncbi:unnamed protein product, partial [Mesorhabditis belari]|uniref:Uncharacterized protein n=1 Tax=Mesorhabditis belari TaxID=2138241 RepID=A0AAF3ESS0_9BILA
MSGTKFEFIAVCYKIFWCPDYDQEPAPGNGYVVFLKSITISAFDGADFDIDYAQNGCNAVHLSEPDRSNVEQINAPCWDPLPFSIEGRTLTAESGEVILNNEGPLTMIKFIQTDPLSTNPECKTFQQELSCLNHVQDSYPVYAGGNPEEELLDVNLDTTTLWTPFWYPWLFDQPDLIAYALMNSHQYYNKAPKVLANLIIYIDEAVDLIMDFTKLPCNNKACTDPPQFTVNNITLEVDSDDTIV